MIFYIKFVEIVKLARGEGDSQLSKVTQCEQDTFEMQVRAANIGNLFIFIFIVRYRYILLIN